MLYHRIQNNQSNLFTARHVFSRNMNNRISIPTNTYLRLLFMVPAIADARSGQRDLSKRLQSPRRSKKPERYPVTTFALPAALFVSVTQTSRSGLEEKGKLVLVLVISMLVIFGIMFALNHYVFRLSPGQNAVQSLSVGFPNFAAVGLPLLGSGMGPGSGVSVAVSLAAGSIFISPLTLAVLEARQPAFCLLLATAIGME